MEGQLGSFQFTAIMSTVAVNTREKLEKIQFSGKLSKNVGAGL
jgi:hypothetical protein